MRHTFSTACGAARPALRRLAWLAALTGAVLGVYLLSACSPIYVVRAAYEESKILLNRQAIEDVLRAGQLPAEDLRKLRVVLSARDFAQSMGLTPKESFTQFTAVEKDVLAWVVAAARPDGFVLHQWWFPFVGRVPYKGYFEKEDALEAARCLEDRDYETWVRGTEAFSTLGWFNDPVLSTTLRQDDARIANTVIHESLHSTVWFQGDVVFNESLANFIGSQGAVEFFAAQLAQCGASGCPEQTQREQMLQLAQVRLAQEQRLGRTVEQLYAALDRVYSSSLPRRAKLQEREVVFDRVVRPLRSEMPGLSVLHKVNNAEIIQLKLYLTGLDGFSALYRQSGCRWQDFLDTVRALEPQRGEGGLFAALQAQLASGRQTAEQPCDQPPGIRPAAAVEHAAAR